jgi:mRNA-degrading endonuclease YafQ of YafQ-DinJ toxin-antitoxin module
LKVSYSTSFKKAYRKKIKNNSDLEIRYKEKLKSFLINPYEPSLRTHKLTGKLKDLWSFWITYEIRVIFYFHRPDEAVFIDIGSHDETY